PDAATGIPSAEDLGVLDELEAAALREGLVGPQVADVDALSRIEIVLYDQLDPHTRPWLATVTADRRDLVRAVAHLLERQSHLLQRLSKTGLGHRGGQRPPCDARLVRRPPQQVTLPPALPYAPPVPPHPSPPLPVLSP